MRRDGDRPGLPLSPVAEIAEPHKKRNGGHMNAESHHGDAPKPARRHDWRRIHHSPLFWVGLFLCLGAITIYVLSEDLSWRLF